MHDVEHNLCLGSRENYFIHFHTSSFSLFFLPITLTPLPHTDSVEQLLYLHKLCFHSSTIIQKPTAVLLKEKKKMILSYASDKMYTNLLKAQLCSQRRMGENVDSFCMFSRYLEALATTPGEFFLQYQLIPLSFRLNIQLEMDNS